MSVANDIRYRYTPPYGTNTMPAVQSPGGASASQRFCLRWNNHQSNLLSVFDQLLHDESFVDVTLAVEGHLLKAHKMILSACSPYFQTLFTNHPESHPIVILKDIPYGDMRSLLDFMYRGEVSVDQDRLQELLQTAETLRIKGLTEVTDDGNALKKIGANVQNRAAVQLKRSATTVSGGAVATGAVQQTQLSQQQIQAAAQLINSNLGAGGALRSPLLNSVLLANNQKRKRGRPRKLSGSSSPSMENDLDSPHSANDKSDTEAEESSSKVSGYMDALTSELHIKSDPDEDVAPADNDLEGNQYQSDSPPPDVHEDEVETPTDSAPSPSTSSPSPSPRATLQQIALAQHLQQSGRLQFLNLQSMLATRLDPAKSGPLFDPDNNNQGLFPPLGRPPVRRRIRRRTASGNQDPAEQLTEMSVRGLDLFKYASVVGGLYYCTECAKGDVQKTFKNKYSFQRHAFLYHEGQQRKVFPCPICLKEFSRPDKMKNHLKTVHEGYLTKDTAGFRDVFLNQKFGQRADGLKNVVKNNLSINLNMGPLNTLTALSPPSSMPAPMTFQSLSSLQSSLGLSTNTFNTSISGNNLILAQALNAPLVSTEEKSDVKLEILDLEQGYESND